MSYTIFQKHKSCDPGMHSRGSMGYALIAVKQNDARMARNHYLTCVLRPLPGRAVVKEIN